MRNSKLIVAAVVSAIVGVGAAFAADLPARTYSKAPAMVADPMTDWSGFYIGGDVGWAGARQHATDAALPSPGFGAPAIGAGLAGFGLLPLDFGSLNSNGFVGGIYTGYNWQFGHTVVGLEGDFSYFGSNSSSSPIALFDSFGGVGPTGATLQLTTSEHWLASVRGRVGYAWDKTLLYATGGVAFTRVNYTQNLAVIPGGDLAATLTPSSSAGFGANKVGYAAGVGAEWMFTQNWIFRLEYLHYGFDGSSGSLPILNPGSLCTAAVNCRFVATTSDLNLDSVRVGLAYKFGGPSKY